MKNLEFLVITGGRGPIDDVRTVSNHSTGRTGWSIADHLYRYGHDVFVIAGRLSFEPSTISIPIMRSVDPELMKRTTKEVIENETMNIDSVVCAAAISDFVVSDSKSGKIESGTDISLNLTPFEKILDEIPGWIKSSRGENSGHVIGFKLLTNSNRDELVSAARSQIIRVGVSAVVANDLSQLTDEGPRALWVTSEIIEELNDAKHIGVAIDALLRA